MLLRFIGRLAGLSLVLVLGAVTTSAEPAKPLTHQLDPAGGSVTSPLARRPAQTGTYCTTNGPGGVTPGGNGNVAGGTDSGVLSGGGPSGSGVSGPNQACDLDSIIGGGGGNVIFSGSVNSGKAAFAFIGGGVENFIDGLDGFVGAGAGNIVAGDEGFIGNGGDNSVSGNESFIGAGDSSSVKGLASFVGAGRNNIVYEDFSFAGGGVVNAITGAYSFLGGGTGNVVGNYRSGVPDKRAGQYTAIVGGQGNIGSGNYGFIGGGLGNVESAKYDVVAGGNDNTASGLGAAVPGGRKNNASGTDSFAGGTASNAENDGAFVWSDDAHGAKPLDSTAPNQFLVRSSGGVSFYTSAALSAGVTLAPGGGSWASISDRTLKTGISPLDGERILAKVATLPLSEWSYISERGVRHVGPMAQDFFAAFGVGEDDRHITAIDADGVALSAIQGLYRVERRQNAHLLEALAGQERAQGALRRALAARDDKVASLEARLDALAAKVASLQRRR